MDWLRLVRRRGLAAELLSQIDLSGRVRSLAAAEVELVASRVKVTAPQLDVVGMVQCTTLIASQGVVSPSYTPGVGNNS